MCLCTELLDSSCFLQTPKSELFMLRFSIAGGLVQDFLLRVALNILSFPPPSEARYTCTVEMVMSWQRAFQEVGLFTQWKVDWAERRSSGQCYSVEHFIENLSATYLKFGSSAEVETYQKVRKSELTKVTNGFFYIIFGINSGLILTQHFVDGFFFSFSFQFWQTISRQSAAWMWVHRPGTLRNDCGESQFLDSLHCDLTSRCST